MDRGQPNYQRGFDAHLDASARTEALETTAMASANLLQGAAKVRLLAAIAFAGAMVALALIFI